MATITDTYKIFIFDTAGKLVDIPSDMLQASFEDVVNGGSSQGTLVVPRGFTDAPNPFPSGSTSGNFANPIGNANIIKLGFEYRVQLYLYDSVNPWWDGRIVDYDPEDFDSQDREQITLTLEGWQVRLGFAALTESVNPGVQPNGVNNGTINADTYLAHLLALYQDSSTFGTSYIGSMPVVLDKLNFDGAELSKAIDDVVKQVVDNTANTFEWWVRGVAGGQPGVVIQANQNPNKQTTGYTAPDGVLRPVTFQYEFKNSTIKAYKITNSSRSLYNNIALYGGKDPTTQVTIYGAYKDSTSISLYGIRQKKVTKSEILSTQSLANYAAVYLLLNGYPQPQGTFKKVVATDAVRAGKWFQIHEPATGVVNQSIKQMRCLKTTISVSGGDKIEQSVTVAAPRPYIDQAFYAAIASASNAVSLASSTFIPVSNAQFFIYKGFDWRSNATATTPVFTAPYGEFSQSQTGSRTGGTTTLSTSVGNDAYGTPQYSIALADSVTAATGDGYYEVVFALNPSTSFGLSITTPDLVCIQGKVAASSGVLKGWAFTVSGGVIIGSTDQRILGSAKAAAGVQQNYPAPTPAAGATTTGATSYTGGISSGIPVSINLTNVPQDGIVGKVVWFIKLAGAPASQWASWAETSLQGMPVPPASQTVSIVFGGVVNGVNYDIGLAYVTTAGIASPNIATISPTGGFATGAIGITGAYFVGGGFVPTVTSPVLTITTSVNNVAANVAATFNITNQPTDGSFARVGTWFRKTGATAWTPWTTIQAVGAGTASPPATGAYSTQFTDLTNGTGYEFGVSGIAIDGSEGTTVTSLGTIVAQTLAIGTDQQLGGALPTPTFTGAGAVDVSTLSGMTSRVTLSFTLTNQPTDGSVSRLTLWYRANGQTNFSPGPSQPIAGLPTPVASAAYAVDFADLQAGIAYDFGVSYENTQGKESAIATLVTNYLAQQIAISGAYIVNSNFTPTITSPVLTVVRSVNNVAADVGATFNITNQPVDGSLARIGTWFRKVGDATYTPWSTIVAVGAGSLTPPTSGAYSTRFTDLTNGNGYEFGVNGISINGTEGPVVSIGTITAQTLAIGNSQLLAGNLPTPNSILAPPSTPSTTTAVAGAIVATTYYVKITHVVNTTGETLPSNETSRAVPANSVLVVNSPTAAAGGQGWNVYVSTATGTETQQNTATIPYGTAWTEPTTGLANHGALPTVSTSNTGLAVSASTLSGLSSRATLTFTLYNQPTDGSFSRITVWLRATGQTNYEPACSQPASTLPIPAATGSYSIDFADLHAGIAYDFGVSYENVQGDETLIASLVSNYTAQQLALAGSYLIDGTAFTPTITTPVLTVVGSINNVAANVNVTFNITNQPTNGSLARIGTWFRKTGDTAYTPWGSIVAVGAGSATPPTSGSYSTRFVDLTNGTGYEFGVNGIAVNGTEGPVVSIGTITAQTLAIGTTQQLYGGLPTPIINVAAPAAPSTGSASGGTLAATTYYVKITYTNAFGESLPSTEVSRAVAINNVLTVTSPPAVAGATGWYPYVSTATGTEKRQGTTPIAIGTRWTEPTTGLSGSTSVPTRDTTISSSAVDAPTLAGMFSRITVSFTVYNQPTDGSLSRLTMWYKAHSQTNFSPGPSVAAGNLPSPTQTQAYVVDFADLNAGVAYDFGVSYENAVGDDSAILTLVTNYVAQTIGIPTAYLLGGTSYTPVLSGATATPSTSVNGISADVTVSFDVTNQPTDGSLSRISYWYRANGSTSWSYYASLPAYGVGTVPGPATGVYSGTHEFVYADLVGGRAYDFGMTLENTQGGEAPVTGTAPNLVPNPVVIASNVTATLITVGVPTPMDPTIKTNGPTITTSAKGTVIGSGGGAYAQAFTFTIGDWAANAQPAWYAGISFYVRLHGDSTSQPHFSGQLPASGVVSLAATAPGLGAGNNYDIGIAYQSADNDLSTIVWPSGISNTSGPNVNPPNSIDGTGGANLVPDAQLAHRLSASNEAYWFEELIDGTSFLCSVGNATQPFNLYSWTSGANSSTRYSNSQPFTLTAGSAYTASCYIDLIGATGSGGMTVCGPITGTITNTNPTGTPTVVASVFQSAGQSGDVYKTFKPTTTGVYVVQVSNSGITVGTTPIYMSRMQVELGSSFTGFKQSTPVQTDTSTTGTIALVAHSSTVQTATSRANAAIGSNNIVNYANHYDTIKNRNALHVSCDGQMPYVSGTTLVIPSVIIFMRPDGSFTRVNTGSITGLLAFSAVWMTWLNGQYTTTTGFTAYNDAGYLALTNDPTKEIIGYINGDGGANTFSAPWINANHFSVMQGVINTAGQVSVANTTGNLSFNNQSGAVTTALDVNGVVNGIGTTRFVSGSTAQYTSNASTTTLNFYASIALPAFGTWFLEVHWNVNGDCTVTNGNIFSDIGVQSGTVSGFSSSQMGLSSPAGYFVNLSTGATGSAAGGQTVQFYYTAHATQTWTLGNGTYSISAFRTS